jgi:beta-galactosidase/beta-glucuronidase
VALSSPKFATLHRGLAAGMIADVSDGVAPSAAALASGGIDRAIYPRPQLVRREWRSLDGSWDFAYDDQSIGVESGWFQGAGEDAFSSSITVPFPPESSASGVGDRGFHAVIWYRRRIDATALMGDGGLQILHFGAVDYRAQVWLGGEYVGSHEGGSTPFSFDVTDILARNAGIATIVLRVEDDPLDVAQPRGKQDWRREPHGIWYHRTSGIWQPVWLERVPPIHVRSLAWFPDAEAGTVRLELELNKRPASPVAVTVRLRSADDELAVLTFAQGEPRSSVLITLPPRSNGQEYESMLWSPDNPHLIDADIDLNAGDGTVDAVESYLGLRSVGWAHGHLLLNDRPFYIRAVLAQGYWQESHLAAPNAAALCNEVQLIKDLGFNTARVHQKVEDPRFLYWADRLGIMIWGEAPSAYEFSATAIARMSREWIEAVRRDVSHPSIAVWVPLNESWGVQQISHFPEQLAYASALYYMTRALDPTRPVVSNDGWEHVESDIWTIHDYAVRGEELAARYADRARIQELMNGIGPLGRRMKLVTAFDRGQPVVVSEFGGISYTAAAEIKSWGYSKVDNPKDFESRLRELFGAIQSSPVLAGFCYTQLADTLQETNGLADTQRRPKLPVDVIRAIVRGEPIEKP